MATTTPARAEEFEELFAKPPGLRGFFTSVQNKVVGARYMVTAFALFLIGGVEALLMRVQLAQPGNDFLDSQSYNELFTMHGTTMMFLFAIPFLEGLATYLLPLQLGARDMPFPRYNAFNYWCYLLGGLILYSSFLVDMVPDDGWFAYVPLSGPEFSGKEMDIWLFGLTLAEIAAVGAAIEIIVAVLKMRPAGMSLDKMPIFAWTMLSVAVLIIIAFIPLIVASVLLEMDRAVGTAFFNPDAGGDPLLWQHLFWIFGHPEVYVMFLPGAAIISHIVPVHAGRRLAAYPLVVVAVIVTAIMSLGLWVHHMYTTGLPPLTLSFFTAASMAITLASGIQVFAWIATLWLGRPRLTVPMLFAVGFVFTFVAGGVTGVMVASASFDAQVHDTFFVVAHFHYVIIGGMLFPVFAGLYHWWPKMTGRMVDDRLGHLSFWLTFLGFHITFFPMHLIGLWGMPRRVYTYPEDLGIGPANLVSTVGAFVLAAGVLVFSVALLLAVRRGRRAPADPWGGDTLEWAIPSPAPSSNWARTPVVTGRHPLWESAPAAPTHTDQADAFDLQPHFRASPLTTVLTAEPDGAVRLANPTVWPLVPAVGLGGIALGLLLESGWVSAAGIAVVVVGLVGWALRNETEMGQEFTEPVGGAYPFEAPGSRAIGWWGALGGALALVVGMGTISFSVLFLQVNAPAWPPGATLDRPLLSLAVGVACAVALAATWWGSRRSAGMARTASGARGAHLTAAAVALVAGVVALVLTVVTWSAGGLDPVAHAYGSGALVLLGGQALSLLFALGITVVAVLARLRHVRDSRPGLVLQNATMFWAAALVVWLISWATTDLLPTVVI